ncbi:MAG: FtsX-like permease family protein [Fibromonadaceae bacterium]|jgi:ABC-type lipoprotein release transport system permease subunit|nr:FtsX-like permease family protein [Fibromonadaceae bacterium]
MAGNRELAKIALRNLARHKVKTVLTILAVMVSVSLYIFVDSWISGMSMESRRNIVNYEMGAAKLQSKLYFEKKDEMPIYENFAGWEAYQKALDEAGYYSAPRFVFSGTLFSVDGSAPIVFNAVDPVAESKVLRYTTYTEAGRYIQNGAFEIVLGTIAAKKLKIDLTKGPNPVQISAVIDIKDSLGKIRHVYQLIPAVVVGTINSPNPVTNANIAYIPLDVLQDESGMMLEGHVTELLIRDKNRGDAELPGKRESAAVISAALDLPSELGIFTWIDYSKDYIDYEKLEIGATKVLTMLLFVLAFLGISNTILMAVLERTKEIGMMRALGMTDNQMVLIYMFEAGFLGLIGSIFGIILGCAINYPMVKYGLDFSEMREAMGADASFRVASLFRSTWNISVIIGAGVAATLLSACMAFFPTRRAVKMPITDSLRFE